MKILVTKFRNLGDVLLSTPLFASLKAIYPDSELHVSVNDFCTQVVADNPHVDKVIPYSRGKKNERAFWQRISAEVRFYLQFKGKYDLVINLTEGDRGLYYQCPFRCISSNGLYQEANPDQPTCSF